jgi:hypothetical protein
MMSLINRLAERAYQEAGPEVMSLEQWAEGARWWANAIADELEKEGKSDASDLLRAEATSDQ